MASERIIACARAWIGTPWRKGHAVKGEGVDCAHFVGAVAHEARVITEFCGADYNYFWFRDPRKNLLTESLEAALRHLAPGLAISNPEQFAPGDVVTVRQLPGDRRATHACFVESVRSCGPRVIQSWQGVRGGVGISDLPGHWPIFKIYRVSGDVE